MGESVKEKHCQNRSFLDQINMDAIEEFCRQIYYRDPYTSMHAEHVADLMAGLASQIGMDSDEISLAYMVGVMHDVGKIRTPESILMKPGRLTDAEFEVMKLHAAEGASMLEQIDGVEPIANIMRHHHERWDGSGYPDGLMHDNIPLFSRMLAICDTFDAMTTNRCYRTPVGLEECVQEIQRCAGSQFDPAVCVAFTDFVKERFGFSIDE